MNLKHKSLVSFLFLTAVFRLDAEVSQPVTSGFVWPVLSGYTDDPEKNIVSPLTRGRNSTCQPPEWHIANGFGNKYSPSSIGCYPPYQYHPGLDFNICPPGSNQEGGIKVFAIADGKVVAKGPISPLTGHFIMIRHDLPAPVSRTDYIFPGTNATEEIQTIYSSYLHTTPSHLTVGEIVAKGQHITNISECCSHLHMEIHTAGDNTGASNCPGCGYCTSPQNLTDRKYLNPTRIIEANSDGITATKTIDNETLTLKLASMNFFGPASGTIMITPSCIDQTCVPVIAAINQWGNDVIVAEVPGGLELLKNGPLSVSLTRADGRSFSSFSYPFTDIKEKAWYWDAIYELWKDDIIKGKTPNAYWPEGPVTRAEFVSLLLRSILSETPTCPAQTIFGDVSETDWFCGYIAAAKLMGIIDEENFFRPNEPILRAEAAGFLKHLLPSALLRSNHTFVDPDINPVDSPAIAAVSCANIMTGPPAGTNCSGTDVAAGERFFCPSDELNRAQSAVIIKRYLDRQKNVSTYITQMNPCN